MTVTGRLQGSGFPMEALDTPQEWGWLEEAEDTAPLCPQGSPWVGRVWAALRSPSQRALQAAAALRPARLGCL